MQYRITTPRLGVDHGTWSGESTAHAIVAMLAAQGIAATVLPHRQAALFDPDVVRAYAFTVAPEGRARLARLGLSVEGFKAEELQPIPMELFA